MGRPRFSKGKSPKIKKDPAPGAGMLVGEAGFEPTTTRTPSVCATRLRYSPARKG